MEKVLEDLKKNDNFIKMRLSLSNKKLIREAIQ